MNKNNTWYSKIKNPLAQNWFELADDELEYAKAGFRETENYRMVCFNCQQVAEKYLKGWLQLQNIEFPKTHNLIELLKLTARKDSSFEDLEDRCKTLDGYYIETRYPGGSLEIYKKEWAEEALEITEQIIEFIRDKI